MTHSPYPDPHRDEHPVSTFIHVQGAASRETLKARGREGRENNSPKERLLHWYLITFMFLVLILPKNVVRHMCARVNPPPHSWPQHGLKWVSSKLKPKSLVNCRCCNWALLPVFIGGYMAAISIFIWNEVGVRVCSSATGLPGRMH